MSDLKILVIGCGSMGSRRAELLQEAGCDVFTYDEDRERAAAAGRPVDEVNKDDLSYDAAVIATPPALHVETARQLIRLGVPALLIEKPLAVDTDFADTLVDEADRAGVITMMGQTLRWHKDVFEMRASIVSGVLGNVIHVSTRFGHRLELWQHPDPVGTYTNGVLIDAATHELDLALWLAGSDAEWLVADSWRTGLFEMEAEDVADVVMGLQSGARATVHVDLADVTYRRQITVVGSHNTALWEWRDDPLMYERETMAFLAAVHGDQLPVDWPDAARGRRVLQLALAAQYSQGRTLKV